MLFLTICSLHLDTSAQDNPFVAQNDLVVVQAESIDLTGDWVIEAGDAGFTGSGYIRWNGADFLAHQEMELLPSPLPFRPVVIIGSNFALLTWEHLPETSGMIRGSG